MFGWCSYKFRHGCAMDLMCSPRLPHLRICMTSAITLRGCTEGTKEAEKGRAAERRLGCLSCSAKANGRKGDPELGARKRSVSSVEVLTRLAPRSESAVSRFFFSESPAFSRSVFSGACLFGTGGNRWPLRNFARLFLNHTWKKKSRIYMYAFGRT